MDGNGKPYFLMDDLGVPIIFGNTQMHFSQSFPFWKQTPRVFFRHFPKKPMASYWSIILCHKNASALTLVSGEVTRKDAIPTGKDAIPTGNDLLPKPKNGLFVTKGGVGAGVFGVHFWNPIIDKKQERDTTDANPLFHLYTHSASG